MKTIAQKGSNGKMKFQWRAAAFAAAVLLLALLAVWLKGMAKAAELPETARIVGRLVIPGIREAEEQETAAETEPERVSLETRIALKMERWQQRNAVQEPEEEPEPELYTERELELLAITIYCEAGSDSITNETRRMVGEVVLNRVADERYPDTIEAVLTQRGQYGRFHYTGVVWPARAGRSVEAHAVERAYECARTVFEAERLLPTDTIYQAGFRQGRECVVHVPGFYFCR